ncbi:MAG: RNA chaperone Hfq [Vicinamibacterales bacterium]
MPQIPDARGAAEPNVQDAFLNVVRRDQQPVSLRLMDGTELEARVKGFDRFAVILDQDGADRLVFKHAIASIRAPRPAPR